MISKRKPPRSSMLVLIRWIWDLSVSSFDGYISTHIDVALWLFFKLLFMDFCFLLSSFSIPFIGFYAPVDSFHHVVAARLNMWENMYVRLDIKSSITSHIHPSLWWSLICSDWQVFCYWCSETSNFWNQQNYRVNNFNVNKRHFTSFKNNRFIIIFKYRATRDGEILPSRHITFLLSLLFFLLRSVYAV